MRTDNGFSTISSKPIQEVENCTMYQVPCLRQAGAKKLWSARFGFRRPWRLPYFAACPAALRGEIFF